MRLKYSITTLLLFIVIFIHGQTATGSADILQGLYKLDNASSVLYIAAHPDDENTRLLSFLAGEKKFNTAYLSITRGDGGQNLIGKEQGEALGLIRTNELLAARRTDGAGQFFTRANDFGFSKNPEETFKFWNRDSILSDVVYIIRKFRPNLIICRFPTTGEGGHGHHTASAMLALDAFDAAADPTRFSWQLATYPVWKTSTIVWNTFNFGTTNTTSPDQIKTDAGAYNVFTGKSYGEVAADSRSMHKSQGFGSPPQRGSNIEYFKYLRGDSIRKDLFENLTRTFSEIINDKSITDCIHNFELLHPEKSISALTAIYKKTLALDPGEFSEIRTRKLEEIKELLLACAGAWLEATAGEPISIPGNDINVNAQVIIRNNKPVKLVRTVYPDLSDTVSNSILRTNILYTTKRKIKIPAVTPYTQPYWLTQPHSQGAYVIPHHSLTGMPLNHPPFKVEFELEIDDLPLKVTRPVQYKSTDPVKGEKYRPLEILPPVTIGLPEKVFVFNEFKSRTISVTVKANTDSIKGLLELQKVEGWDLRVLNPDIAIGKKGEEITTEISITPLKGNSNSKLSLRARLGSQTYDQGIQRVEYDHIPPQFILSKADAGLVFVEMEKVNGHIGYIQGAGDDVSRCLQQAGYKVTFLDNEYLARGDLSIFSAIITGVRAYNTNEKLQLYYPRLMKYVQDGGNMLVQYNTNSRVGPLQAKIGPWPFNISRDRVTDETAPITFISEKHIALNAPNKITKKDFENWVQERGIYFATETDQKYTTLLRMNDAGEKPHDGSVIIGGYGKGNFVYTGLAFFRQLPAGVPGAWRLFINLISLPKNKNNEGK